jgi:serine/threonine protein kinase
VCDLRWPVVDGAIELTALVHPVACDEPHARIYALQPLPGRAYAFVAGLETRELPVGLVECRTGSWTLEIATRRPPNERPEPDGASPSIERSSLAPGKMPTRAVAVAAVDDLASRYLAVTGSEDGLVCAISFGYHDEARNWTIRPWDRVPDAITSIVLGRHRPQASPDLFSCYLGTNAGDTYALSIVARGSAQPSEPAFGDFDARPLWRDMHDAPVVMVRLWRTPLFPAAEGLSDEVLLVASEGRLCIYNHAPDTGRRVSASFNYFFRGMRFDRIALPERLRALTVVQDGREFVAAGAGGRLYLGKLVYLRDSIDRRDPDERAAPAHGALPDEMWARLRQLLAASHHDDPFEVAAAGRDPLKLALCELIRLEGGPLSSYALREQLELHPWNQLDASELSHRARWLLDALDPEDPEDAQRIKVILKSLCGAFLSRGPPHDRSQIDAVVAQPDDHARTAVVCSLVNEYVTRTLAYSTRAASRLRIVVVKELLRVHTLRHIACGDAEAGAIREAVASILDSCLRDDERLVRVEALRTVSIVLRNVGVMADIAGSDRRKLLDALFPDAQGSGGLESAAWLLELIVGSLTRFPSFRRRSALISGAWYHISALLPLFRIFNDRTLALCDYLIRAGLSVDVVAMCARSLRGQRMQAIRSRIEHLYLIGLLDRERFIEHYDRDKASHQVLLKEMALTPRPSLATEWHQIDDAAMAFRLTELLTQLARMWNVRSRAQITLALATPAVATVRANPGREAPLAWLERVVAELASLAGDLLKLAARPGVPTARSPEEVSALDRLTEIGETHGAGGERASTLTAPIQIIVAGVVAAWREVYDPRPPETNMEIDGEINGKTRKYKLGSRISEGGFGAVFELQEPPELRNRSVIKVLRRLNSPSAAERFLDGARFNKQLCEQADDRKYVVTVTDILDKRPYLAYVMPKYRGVLETYLTDDFHNQPQAPLWTERVAEHVGRALRATHERGRCHGDVNPTNILVSFDGKEPIFHLGDFDLAYGPGETELRDPAMTPIGAVPELLSQKQPADDVDARRRWDDIVALAAILYRMLTGTPVDPRKPDHLNKYIAELHRLEKARPDKPPTALLVIEALTYIFEPSYRSTDIAEFLSWISPDAGTTESPVRRLPVRPSAPPVAHTASRTSTFDPAQVIVRRQQPPAKGPHTILFVAANPDGTSRLELHEQCADIEGELRLTEGRDELVFQAKWAVTVDELMRHLLTFKPTIVHFNGQGGAADAARAGARIQLKGEDGGPQLVDARALTRMIAAAAPSVRLVVLNACFSDEMARELCQAVDCVVGMRGAIGDASARSFAVAFYRALGFRRSVRNAVEQAGATLAGKNHPDDRGPVCVARNDIDPDALFLPGPAPAEATAPPSTYGRENRIVGHVARSAGGGGRIHRSSSEMRTRADSSFQQGRQNIYAWQDETTRAGWTVRAWQLLGEALQHAHDALEAELSNQRSWTLLADTYHLIGEMELARECLAQSWELATPGPHFPGRYYKYVKANMDSGAPFNDARGLKRQPPPRWFYEQYERYLKIEADAD